MHPNVRQSKRRVHGAELKAKVLAQCREPRASVASVAMANGLNANLVRKWLAGRGLKRAGLTMQSAQQDSARPAVMPPGRPTPVGGAAQGPRFVPVELPATRHGNGPVGGASSGPLTDGTHILVELRGASTCLAVRWPLSQAPGCTAWLRELAGAVLK